MIILTVCVKFFNSLLRKTWIGKAPVQMSTMWRDSTDGKAADCGVGGPGFTSQRLMYYSSENIEINTSHQPSLYSRLLIGDN